ncbi:hypothetical protein KP509_30G003300 [Ceratopteris richardii]|uniref:Uncharacterized protein n=1 Tax=Ceratopteris richardii TaxID=49495 RepID=A0A8T2R0U9_CERRI|nr:hypothetical protein KP509_30G003300 [Ceratopteris richardii]
MAVAAFMSVLLILAHVGGTNLAPAIPSFCAICATVLILVYRKKLGGSVSQRSCAMWAPVIMAGLLVLPLLTGSYTVAEIMSAAIHEKRLLGHVNVICGNQMVLAQIRNGTNCC